MPRTSVPRACEIVRRHLDWLDRTRAEDDGLIGILQPDETGLDATPTYDRVLGWRAHPYPGFVALVHANRRRGFSYRRARAEGAFTAIDVLVNTAWALSWYGLARLGDAEAGERAESDRGGTRGTPVGRGPGHVLCRGTRRHPPAGGHLGGTRPAGASRGCRRTSRRGSSTSSS